MIFTLAKTATWKPSRKTTRATRARSDHTSSINTSVLDGWTDSQAAVQFSELYEKWRLSAQGVSDALTGMGSLLTSVAGSYQQHEADMAARIGALL